MKCKAEVEVEEPRPLFFSHFHWEIASYLGLDFYLWDYATTILYDHQITPLLDIRSHGDFDLIPRLEVAGEVAIRLFAVGAAFVTQ